MFVTNVKLAFYRQKKLCCTFVKSTDDNGNWVGYMTCTIAVVVCLLQRHAFS